MTSKDFLKVLKKLGWYEVNQVGSHKQFKHDKIKGRVTLPHPQKDFSIGTQKSILKQMQISQEEFEKWLNS